MKDAEYDTKENAPEMHPAPSTTVTLTVLTLNLGKEKQQLAARMSAVASLVERHRPDLIMFQELMDNEPNRFNPKISHLAHLRKRLGDRYAFPPDALFKEQGRGFKVALLVRRLSPCSSLLAEEGGGGGGGRLWVEPLDHRPAMVGMCTLPNGVRLGLASCHLSPDNNVAERTAQIRGLHAALLGGVPPSTSSYDAPAVALIAGDTNMSESGADAKASEESGFVDCWRAARGAFPGDGRTRPRPAGHAKEGQYERIDRFFVRGGTQLRCDHMEVTGTEPVSSDEVREDEPLPKWWTEGAGGQTISDHFALLGRFPVTGGGGSGGDASAAGEMSVLGMSPPTFDDSTLSEKRTSLKPTDTTDKPVTGNAAAAEAAAPVEAPVEAAAAAEASISAVEQPTTTEGAPPAQAAPGEDAPTMDAPRKGDEAVPMLAAMADDKQVAEAFMYMCVDMCMDVCVDIRTDMSMEMCIGVCEDMCMDMDTCLCTCLYKHVHGRVCTPV